MAKKKNDSNNYNGSLPLLIGYPYTINHNAIIFNTLTPQEQLQLYIDQMKTWEEEKLRRAKEQEKEFQKAFERKIQEEEQQKAIKKFLKDQEAIAAKKKAIEDEKNRKLYIRNQEKLKNEYYKQTYYDLIGINDNSLKKRIKRRISKSKDITDEFYQDSDPGSMPEVFYFDPWNNTIVTDYPYPCDALKSKTEGALWWEKKVLVLDKNVKIRVKEGFVKLYGNDYLEKTLNTSITDFKSLEWSGYNKISEISSDTEIKILKTITHTRTGRDQKTYKYIMCKIEVIILGEGSKKASVGQVGYLWHTFGDKVNIGYYNSDGKPINNTAQYGLTKNQMEIDGVIITFSVDDDRRIESNSRKMIDKLKQTVILKAIAAAAKQASIYEVVIGFVDYGSSSSHGEGRAVDIAIVKFDIDGTKTQHIYKKIYDDRLKETDPHKWRYEEYSKYSEEIEVFEKAFIAQEATYKNYRFDILGPWNFYWGNYSILNPVETYGEDVWTALADFPSPQKYVEMQKKDKDLPEDYKLYKEDKFKKIIAKLVSENKTTLDPSNENDRELLRLQFEHRHHGHFAISPK